MFSGLVRVTVGLLLECHTYCEAQLNDMPNRKYIIMQNEHRLVASVTKTRSISENRLVGPLMAIRSPQDAKPPQDTQVNKGAKITKSLKPTVPQVPQVHKGGKKSKALKTRGSDI